MIVELLEHSRVVEFDARVDKALDRLRGHQLADRSFYALSEAANHSILWHVWVWIRALVVPSRRRDAIELSLALGIESALVNGPIKMLFRRARPMHDGDRPHKLRIPKTSSFPSGHATSAFCAAVLMSRDSHAKPAYFAVAALVATSRIYVRIHHASDVVAGAAIGTGLGVGARRILRR